MMRSRSRHKRTVLRAIGLAALLAISTGVGGCVYDESGQIAGPEEFCGILYPCGSDSDSNRGGSQTATGSSSDSSSGGSSSTGDSSAAPTGGE